jgi:mannan endo-1,4-beta-mannosidase
MIMKWTGRFSRGKQYIRYVGVLLVTVSVGYVAMHTTQAATFAVSPEAESGTILNPAAAVSNASASAGGAVRFQAATGSGGSNPTGSFYIVGKDIIDPTGNKYYPMGANVGIQGGFDWQGTADGHADDSLAWGWNTVRLTVYCTDGASWMPRATLGYQGFLNKVDSFVQEYSSKKIVTMIECHDALDNTSEIDQFWGDIATKYKNNPYVWFNAGNEPYWNENAAWVTFQRKYLNLVRSKGAENIFVADALNAGNDAGWDGALPLYDNTIGPALASGQCNVLFSLHAYGGTALNFGTTAYINSVQSKNMALVVGEFGYTIDNSSTAGTYADNLAGATDVFNLAPGKGVGMLWWHATHGDNYSLKNDGSAFYNGGNANNLSNGGQKVWNIGHNKPVLGSFGGRYADSNCTSAAGH